MIFVDTHAHVDFPEFDSDRDAVMERASAAHVSTILTVGTSLASSHTCCALAQKYPQMYASVGIHPHEVKEYRDVSWIDELEMLMMCPRVVALGEVGLDFYRNISPPDEQKELLRTILRLHKKHRLPLIIHCRDAHDALFTLFEEECTGVSLRGVMHCFSGDEKVLERALACGLFISFTATVTYPKNEQLRHLSGLVPDNRLLLETDAPYLAPQTKRGARNEPAFITETAACVAQIRNISVEDIARITTKNAHDLFGIPTLTESARFVYKIRHSLYINTTRACSNACYFCIRYFDDIVKGYNLRIDRDPSAEEVLREIDEEGGGFDEVVFCGFGEPFMRLDFIIAVSRVLKKKNIRVRIDTNGHANLIYGRNVLPELVGLIDKLCVSLNAPDEALYRSICRPTISGNVFQGVKDFILEAKKYVPEVEITFLDLPEVSTPAMTNLAQVLGVSWRLRRYNRVG